MQTNCQKHIGKVMQFSQRDVRNEKIDLNKGVKEKVLQGTSDKREAITEIAFGFPAMRSVVQEVTDDIPIITEEFTMYDSPRMTETQKTIAVPAFRNNENVSRERLMSAAVTGNTQRNYFSSKLVKALEVESQRNIDEISQAIVKNTARSRKDNMVSLKPYSSY